MLPLTTTNLDFVKPRSNRNGKGFDTKGHVEELTRVGYTIIQLSDSDSLITEVNLQIEELVSGGNFRTNSKIYSYNTSPRVVESWKHSPAAHSLAFHPQILGVLRDYFSSEPLPFSTINFLRSTQQPLHSDYVHFGTFPPFQLAAAWVALEDIDPKSGPIRLVPESHRFPEFFYEDLGLPVAQSMGQVKEFYGLYEEWVKNEIYRRELDIVCPEMRRGDAILWLANLLHGSPECENPSMSRRSQVTHYHTADTVDFYNPVFSTPRKGKFKRRVVEYIPQN